MSDVWGNGNVIEINIDKEMTPTSRECHGSHQKRPLTIECDYVTLRLQQ
jgi:hypothetical protein